MALRIVVTLNEDRLSIDGPQDKLQAVGLLELAKARLLAPTTEAPRIAPASVIPGLGVNGKAG
jgi:hypothetical protein